MEKHLLKENKNNDSQNSSPMSWRIFKIMSEFVDGFEKLDNTGPCITIFGSARTSPDNEYYRMAEEISRKLVEAGYGIITGGGPGIMEAGNKGAIKKKGVSIGLNIDLPWEQNHNRYIDRDKLINFKYFFVRKVMLVRYAQGFVVMPGGFGTLDEMFEIITLIQTKKSRPMPVILVGREYWDGLYKWSKKIMLEKHKTIGEKDLDLLKIVDSSDEVVSVIKEFYKTQPHTPNF